jgi:hypothetical protein
VTNYLSILKKPYLHGLLDLQIFDLKKRDDIPDKNTKLFLKGSNLDETIPLNNIHHETINSFVVYKNKANYEVLQVLKLTRTNFHLTLHLVREPERKIRINASTSGFDQSKCGLLSSISFDRPRRK